MINNDLYAVDNGINKKILFNESFSFTFGLGIDIGLKYSYHRILRFLLSLFYRRKMCKTGRQILIGIQIGGGFRLIYYGTVII